MNAPQTEATTRARVSFGHAAVITADLDRYRRFYEDVLGLTLAMISTPIDTPFRRVGAFTDRHARSIGLLVFEVPGYTPELPADKIGQRGRIDHLAFDTADDADFTEILARLVDAGASSGEVTALGPVRSALFVDPDGAHHNLQVNVPSWRADPDSDVPDANLVVALIASGS